MPRTKSDTKPSAIFKCFSGYLGLPSKKAILQERSINLDWNFVAPASLGDSSTSVPVRLSLVIIQYCKLSLYLAPKTSIWSFSSSLSPSSGSFPVTSDPDLVPNTYYAAYLPSPGNGPRQDSRNKHIPHCYAVSYTLVEYFLSHYTKIIINESP